MSSIFNKYKLCKEWTIVESAINELKDNNDLQIITHSDNVIGHILKRIVDSKFNSHILYTILEELDKAKIHYKLERYREDTIMICATVVGSRFEIEVFNNGSVETSVFTGDESLESGMDIIVAIINNNKD